VDQVEGSAAAAAAAEPIRQYGDPVLRRRARSVRTVNASVRQLSGRMADAMYEANGVGLAAPQIGEARRVVVIDVGEGLQTLVNPRLMASEGSVVDTEGCLSVRGLVGEVERAERVRVRAIGLDGKEFTIEAEGLLARALQHELDHLDGVLFVDRASSISDADDAKAGDPGDCGDSGDSGDTDNSEQEAVAQQAEPLR
jgi:peptide deformylase